MTFPRFLGFLYGSVPALDVCGKHYFLELPFHTRVAADALAGIREPVELVG